MLSLRRLVRKRGGAECSEIAGGRGGGVRGVDETLGRELTTSSVHGVQQAVPVIFGGIL